MTVIWCEIFTARIMFSEFHPLTMRMICMRPGNIVFTNQLQFFSFTLFQQILIVQDIGLKYRVAALALNMTIYSVCKLLFDVDMDSIDECRGDRKNATLNQVLGFVSGVPIYTIILGFYYRLALASFYEQLGRINLVKTKFQTIIENSDQAIISTSEKGFTFFNKRGKQILDQSIAQIDEVRRAKC